MKKTLKNRKGFTLVELIIVIVIIAVLAAIAIPLVTGFVDRAEASATLAEANSARMAVLVLLADPTTEGDATTTVARWNELIAPMMTSEGTIFAITATAAGELTMMEFRHTDRGNRAIWQNDEWSTGNIPTT